MKKIINKSFVERLFDKRLLKNKVYSLGLILIGFITVPLSGGNCTGLMLMLMLGLPLFFAKKNVIN